MGIFPGVSWIISADLGLTSQRVAIVRKED
jgi:hypothetical protein